MNGHPPELSHLPGPGLGLLRQAILWQDLLADLICQLLVDVKESCRGRAITAGARGGVRRKQGGTLCTKPMFNSATGLQDSSKPRVATHPRESPRGVPAEGDERREQCKQRDGERGHRAAMKTPLQWPCSGISDIMAFQRLTAAAILVVVGSFCVNLSGLSFSSVAHALCTSKAQSPPITSPRTSHHNTRTMLDFV